MGERSHLIGLDDMNSENITERGEETSQDVLVDLKAMKFKG